MTQPAGEWTRSPEERRAESSASLGKRRSTLRSIRKAWVEEKRRMLLSSGGPTGSGGGRCRRFGNCHSFSTDSMRDFRYSKAFMGSFSRKGEATREPKSRRTSGVVIERIFSLENPGMEWAQKAGSQSLGLRSSSRRHCSVVRKTGPF